jgi:phospholipid/cholesterol/gamma-HCH transport system ATP-binding protein
MGLIRPDRGAIYIEGKNIFELNEQEQVELRKKMAFVFQGSALFDSLTVFENVAFGLTEASNKSPSLIKRIALEKLDWVGLADSAAQYPAQLSGGMKKRVSIARALAAEPEIILYDEPTTGLDPLVSKNIEELIVRLKRELNLTSVVVTHQISTIFRVSERIIFLNQGRLEDVGSVEQLTAGGLVNPELQKFIEAGRV